MAFKLYRSWKTLLAGSINGLATGALGIYVVHALTDMSFAQKNMKYIIAGFAVKAASEFAIGFFARDDDVTSEDVGLTPKPTETTEPPKQ